MSFLPADGTDRITQEIQEHMMEFLGEVKPLSRDFTRGVTFGTRVPQGEVEGVLESIILHMKSEAPDESDLFYLGSVFGSMIIRSSEAPNI